MKRVGIFLNASSLEALNKEGVKETKYFINVLLNTSSSEDFVKYKVCAFYISKDQLKDYENCKYKDDVNVVFHFYSVEKDGNKVYYVNIDDVSVIGG